MSYEAEIDGPVCPECGGNHATDQDTIDGLNRRILILERGLSRFRENRNALLAALQETLDCLEDHARRMVTNEGPITKPIIERARAAIAKARKLP